MPERGSFIADDSTTARQIRSGLLREREIRLLRTKRARRRSGGGRRWWTADLISYRPAPGRLGYMVLLWFEGTWENFATLTLREAQLLFESWGQMPRWWRPPALLAELEDASEAWRGRGALPSE